MMPSKNGIQGFLGLEQVILPGLGDRVTHFARVLEIEPDSDPGVLEPFRLTPTMRDTSQKIGDLSHKYLVFHIPRHKDLVTMRQFDFPSCSIMMAAHRQLSST